MMKRDPIPEFFIKKPLLLKLWLDLTVLTSIAFYSQWMNSESRWRNCEAR